MLKKYFVKELGSLFDLNRSMNNHS